MPLVVGIRFKKCGKIYDFDPNGIELKQGERVTVESEYGLSVGITVDEAHEAGESDRQLRKVLRKVSQEDLDTIEGNKALEREAFEFCTERIMARGLPMKLIVTETILDRKRIIFYFVAEKRIDFRELVKDLAQKFKTRIELRQIGVRDKAKMTGGLGICGRQLCCCSFLTRFEPISIKMAKKQELVLNTSKLSGICGRLICCLGYEFDENNHYTGMNYKLEKEKRAADEALRKQYEASALEAQTDLPPDDTETAERTVRRQGRKDGVKKPPQGDRQQLKRRPHSKRPQDQKRKKEDRPKEEKPSQSTKQTDPPAQVKSEEQKKTEQGQKKSSGSRRRRWRKKRKEGRSDDKGNKPDNPKPDSGGSN